MSIWHYNLESFKWFIAAQSTTEKIIWNLSAFPENRIPSSLPKRPSMLPKDIWHRHAVSLFFNHSKRFNDCVRHWETHRDVERRKQNSSIWTRACGCALCTLITEIVSSNRALLQPKRSITFGDCSLSIRAPSIGTMEFYINIYCNWLFFVIKCAILQCNVHVFLWVKIHYQLKVLVFMMYQIAIIL